MGKTIMKKGGKDELYKTTFYALNLGLFVCTKNYFEDTVTETEFKIEYFYRLLDLKKCLE